MVLCIGLCHSDIVETSAHLYYGKDDDVCTVIMFHHMLVKCHQFTKQMQFIHTVSYHHKLQLTTSATTTAALQCSQI